MNIQAEKIELIRLITEIESEKVLKKIKSILSSVTKEDEAEKIESNPVMVNRIGESRRQIIEGRGVKLPLDDLDIQQYNKDIDQSIADIKTGNFVTQEELEKEMERW